MKIIKSLSLFFIIISFISCNSNEKITVKHSASAKGNSQVLPFSEVVEVGDLLFLAGKIGKNPKTNKIVFGGIETETAQTLKNIETVLKAHGSDLNHVVKSTVILSDINDFSKMNEVYRTFFTDNLPARTTFAADLVLGAKIEIEVVAVKK